MNPTDELRTERLREYPHNYSVVFTRLDVAVQAGAVCWAAADR